MGRMTAMPTPKDELERRILAGDITGVMDCIDAADAATRAAMRPTVERLIFGRWPLLRADPENPLCVDGRIDKDLQACGLDQRRIPTSARQS